MPAPWSWRGVMARRCRSQPSRTSSRPPTSS
jgi:hypothetical protein